MMLKNELANRIRITSIAAVAILIAVILIGVTRDAGASTPFVQIVKTGPDTANPGDDIVFTLTVRTYASGVVTHAVVWDDLMYDAVDRYEIFRRHLTDAELATLNSGGAVVIEVPFRVPCDAGGHALDNDAYVEATFADGTIKFATNDHDVTIPRPDQVNCAPAIDLEKLINGQDADTPAEAVVVSAGDLLTFEYIVTNTGDAVLRNIQVIDDNETPGDPSDDVVIGFISNLAPGQSQTFTRQATAELGLHADVGTACGTSSQSSGSQHKCDDDAAHYTAGEGCTPGFWKQKQHFGLWVNTGPGNFFDNVFGVDAPGDQTLLEALGAGGGEEGALGRHAVAALLNAANPNVGYFYSEAEVIALVQGAYATGDFEAVKDLLEAQNELVCPLD